MGLETRSSFQTRARLIFVERRWLFAVFRGPPPKKRGTTVECRCCPPRALPHVDPPMEEE